MFGHELPVDRKKRWALIADFIAQWFQPAPNPPGVPAAELAAAEARLGLSLPSAFREWYEQHGARTDVWSPQDRLLAPDKLRIDDETLIFCVENQHVVEWGIRLQDLASDDPPVVVSDPDSVKKTWLIESPTTSEFVTQLALSNAKWSAPCSANGYGTADAFAALERTYPRIRVADMHWPAWPTRFYGTNDIVIETNGGTWIWASAKSQDDLVKLDALLRAAGMDFWAQSDLEA